MRYWLIALLGLLAACTSTGKSNPNTSSDQDFEAMIQKLEKDKSAFDSLADPQTKSVSLADEQSEELQASVAPEIPLTAAEEAVIRAQIEKNWDLRGTTGAPGLENILVLIRVALKPDGTVIEAQIINDVVDSYVRAVSESCLRAVHMSSPLKLPPGKTYNTMVLRFRPSEVSF
ncbi:MAG: hypothetical protein E6Q98_09630 [Rhodospirillaceae bacterium]|nr:MAG: hypothetical protein E6Q98_09630 [Rhodospirillaceae bacterium]